MGENPRNNMWKMLARSIVTNFDSSHLQKILVMIQNNLTFDDPGLFALHLTRQQDKRLKEEISNTWLINQLIHLLLVNEEERLTNNNIALQKEILSACLLKQPWLFRKLVKRYIELIKFACKRVNDKIDCDIFCIQNVPLGLLDKQYTFQTLKITCEKAQNQLIEHIINIITHVMNIAMDLYQDLFLECSDAILLAFSKLSFAVKKESLRYILTITSPLTDLDDFMEHYLLLILKGCEIIIKNASFYLRTQSVSKQDIEEMCERISDIYDILISVLKTSHNYPRICFVKHSLSFLKSILENPPKPPISQLNKLQANISSFIIEDIIYTNSNYLDLLPQFDELYEILIQPSDFVETFSMLMFKDAVFVNLRELPNKKSVVAFGNHLRQVLDNLEDQNCIDGDTDIKWRIILSLMQIKSNVTHFYNLWHQDKHLKSAENCDVCANTNRFPTYEFMNKTSIKFIDPIYVDGALFSSLINLLKNTKTINVERYYMLSEIMCLVLQCVDFSHTKDLQIHLFDFISKPLQQSYQIDLNWHQKLTIENVENDFHETLELQSISLLLNMNVELISRQSLDYLKKIVNKIIRNGKQTNVFRALITNSLLNIVLNNLVSLDVVQNFILNSLSLIPKINNSVCDKLCEFLCTIDNQLYIFKTRKTFSVDYKIICFKCNREQLSEKPKEELYITLLKNCNGLVIPSEIEYHVDNKTFQRMLISFITKHPTCATRILSSLMNHCDLQFMLDGWPNLLKYNELYPMNIYPMQIKLLLQSSHIVPLTHDQLKIIGEKILHLVNHSLQSSYGELQVNVIETIFNLSLNKVLPEKTLLSLFKMMLLFSIRSESSSYYFAILCASEMCSNHGITSRSILNWHKHNIFKFIIALCASMFLRNGIGINKAVNNISKMLGYLGPREFISKHYKLISTMLLPWCIKFNSCKELFQELAVVTQRDVSIVLRSSFLTSYSYLHLRETLDVDNKCIDFLVSQTECSLYDLLNSDIKRTVAEILIHYHKNPRAVMLAFRTLFHENGKDKDALEVHHSTIIDYITKRFLGVLTFFETCLVDADFEKSLKYDALLSLGEIIRFIGSKHITPFRFKILAMLKTAQTIDGFKTQNVCLSLWNIFIHTVDILTLGPLLSTILVSLEQLLEFYPNEVNNMLEFLIISNGSLLSVHIPDLYFVENMAVDQEIKNFVKNQIEKTRKNDSFPELLKFYLRQIKHENIAVRVYGLKYLTNLFRKNRNKLNNMIIERKNINTTLESVIETLMIGSKHVDKQLQLASAKCLAEFGAIEPSHLPPNYAPQSNFALSIHTDSFAIMALQELCRAYQFQKDTKYVDSFSLAIQEILLARGVCPKLNKKMEVWESIPEHMRQLMEPLLTSCYTSLRINSNIPRYPIFGSSSCQTCEEWGFNWTSAMIATITDEDTANLLNSFKPSIKRDANMLLVFLPYIILHSLQNGVEDNKEKIYEELRYVFESVTTKDGLNDTNLRKRTIRGLKTLQFLPLTNSNNSEETKEHIEIKCAKVGFKLLDFLDCWLREWHKEYIGHTPDDKYTVIESFLKRFDKKFIAISNYDCDEFARALMYIEAYIERDVKNLLQENLQFLARIYAELSDSDSFEGAIGLKTGELSLSEQILANNVTENFLDSAACFEKLLQSNTLSTNNINDIVQYYLLLDTPQIALLISEGILNKLGNNCMDTFLKEVQAEPLWRLSSFDELEKLLETSDYKNSSNWGIQCGQALLSFRNHEIDTFSNEIERIQTNILKVLKTGGIERNCYGKSYPHVMKLHLISEIEKAKKLLNNLLNTKTNEKCSSIFSEFITDWKLRLEILQPTPKVLEPVLCLRRLLLMEVVKILSERTQNGKKIICDTINYEIGEMWLQSAELARDFGLYQRAQLYIMNAEPYNVKNIALEKAKLFWKKGDQTKCFKVIDQKIEEITTFARSLNSVDSLPTDMRALFADMKLFQATCNAESMNVRMELNIQLFKDSVKANQKSEKCLVHFAQYMEKIYYSSKEEYQNNQGMEILLDVVILYGKSMSFGCEFVYQSMPRMLSIWFDFTTKPKKDNFFRKIMIKINENLEKFSRTLPLFVFFTAFSQLISRICHPSIEVYQVLKGIIVRLIEKFPQQSLWMLLSVFKSSYVGRVKRCMEVFNDKALANNQMQKLISDFNSLAEKLIELTNKEIPHTYKNPTVSSLVRSLPKLFLDANFSKIIMPFEQYMQPVLPPINERNNPPHAFNAFPKKPIYIQGITEKITVLNSLQRPRKVSLVGDDGKHYTVMMKPKDDLRKDFRLMEFNAVVKQYLHQNPEARHRRLHIRTYAVVPLNEECGLIEWIHNLNAFRQILMSFYKRRNLAMSPKELRQLACSTNDPVEKKRDVFLKRLLPKHPPIFGEWFRQCFTTPHNWYQARTAYIRTTAVMSIVGYILGLGDRHGENILFDDTNGDTVHVDFNCLFNKGESFEYPEKVPFRLTHNMVHAMGPLKIEGSYRKCCEITMRVLQTQKATLMSILRPFVYDPLVSWSKVKTDGLQERTDSKAMENVRHIEERLKGFVKINGNISNMPLSAEGQVNFVIGEATDIDNLAAMYIGWAPYM